LKYRKLAASCALACLPMAAFAGDGLVAPAVETVWPQWHARITVQTAAVSPLSYSHWADGAKAARSLQGAALLGDYYFATPAFGSFRASGGLMMGSTGGAWLSSASAGPRLGLTVQTAGHVPPGAAEGLATMPYLGLGFSSALLGSNLALTADLGMVAGGNLGQALLGNQGMERALRELRLAPVFQLGVRYTF
jgi:hypothetical protein